MISVPGPALSELANSFGTNREKMKHFGGGEEFSDGVLYSYPYEDRQRLLKILAIPAEEEHGGMFCMNERLQFMRYLGENGARITFPRLSPGGKLQETCPSGEHLFVGYCMEIAPGKAVKEKTWDPVFFREWGRTIGLMHRLAKEYPTWETSVEPESGKEYLNWREEWDGFYNWLQDDDVKEKWLELLAELEALPATRDSCGFIHNDPHLWNLLYDGSEITVLDFDVANHHWFITDISIACQHVLAYQSGGSGGKLHNRKKLVDFLRIFMQGYESENHLHSEWLDRIDIFIAYRRILLFAAMYGWISSDAKIHKSWKGMIMQRPEVLGAVSGEL